MGADRRDDTTGPLLSVENLEKHYPVRSGLLRRTTGYVKAVDGISFEIREGETVGLVGESGCGKSTAATTILGLEEPTGGTVRFDGQDVTDHDTAERRRFRRRAGVVFQDPTTAFDPRMTVLESVAEPLEIHGITDPDRRRRLVADLIERVGLSESMLYRYPDDLSGGEKQRLALARALIRALAAPDGADASAEEVPSPTFTLVQTYDRLGADGTPLQLWHFDLYRLGAPDEVDELGWEEALADGAVLVEWPDRLGARLPGDRLDVALGFDAAGTGRRAVLQSAADAWGPRLDALAADD